MQPDTVDPMETVREFWDDQTFGDPTLFLALGSLMRLHRFTSDRIDAHLKAHAITRNGYLLLMRLVVSPNGSRILSKLADDLMVHPTTITLTIDRLEEDGLVAKVPHEHDRRAIRATITGAGRSTALEVSRDLAEIGYGFDGISKKTAEQLLASLTASRRAVGDLSTITRGAAPSEDPADAPRSRS